MYSVHRIAPRPSTETHRGGGVPLDFNLLNALESGFHGHSGSGDIALHVTEQIARLVPLIDGEFSRGCIPFGIEG
jgi:hypothetical protein